MGRRSPSSEILQVVTVLWNHPFLTGIAILMFTPPFFPLVVYFSPLLMSTALCVAALVSMGSRMEKIKAEGEGTHLDVHGVDAWVERDRPDRENVAAHYSAERDLQRWVTGTECESTYRGVDVSSWTGADVELTRAWVNPALERVVEREIVAEPQEETDEDRWNAWVKEYEARPGWGETEASEPAAVVTATTKSASISKPDEENLSHKEEAMSLPKPENTHQPVMQVPIRKVETVGIQHGKQASIKEGVPCTSHSHVSDVQALDSTEKLLCQEMGAPRIEPIISLPKIGVRAEVFAHLKTAGLGSNSNMQARGLPPEESLPGEETPAGSSGACAQGVQAPEKKNKLVEENDIGAETPLLRHLKSSRFERRGRIVEYSPLPIRSSKSVGQDRNLTTSERSPRLLHKSKTGGSKSSGKNLAQYADGGATESGRTGKAVINSEVSPRLLQSLKTAGLGSSDEGNYQGGHGGHGESGIHSTPVQVRRLQGGGGDRSVTASESAPRASLKSVGSRISDEWISQDGYGRCTEHIGHRMPVPASKVERDGLENTGASSEFYTQMVLKTAGVRNSKETISQERYGGPKQNNELKMLVQMRKPERGDVERSVTTPKRSPCLSQKLEPSGLTRSKDNNPQGACGGAREVSDPKMPAEAHRPERIGLEKTLTASGSSPCVLPKLKTAESKTSNEKVSEEAVELNVSKEENRLEVCEKKHATALESAPLASLKSIGTRSSDERISRDGYGHCTENFGHRMPVPTSRVERDGLEISGAISESSPQMVLKTAGIQNSEETTSQNRNGGFKQKNELRVLAQMSKLERGDVEKSVSTPKYSPCFSHNLEATGIKSPKDNDPQGGCGGAREVDDPKMLVETNKPERIRLEKTVTAPEISPCILPRLKTAESETSKEVLSEEVVELNVSKEVNGLEACEKKHLNSLEPALRASLKSVRISDARISQDGYCETIGRRMPVSTSIEKDGLEITGVNSEFSPEMVLKTAGIRNSEETISQDRYGGFKQNNDLRMLAESETSKEVLSEEVVELNVSKEVNGLEACEKKHVNTLESALRASLKSVRNSDVRISQDGYRETIGRRMPVSTSIEKDGLEITGVNSEFSPEMVLKTAGIRNSEETISQDRYGGYKQNNELRMLAQMSMLERGNVEKSGTTPKCPPCVPQNLEASRLKWFKDIIPLGGCAGIRDVIEPKMLAEANRPERIELEKTVTASEISPCILQRLKTVESETSKEKVFEEAVQLNVSKEVNGFEAFEKKHVMDVKNPEPEVRRSTPSRRRSHVNRKIILEGEVQESQSHQNFAGPVKGVLASAMDVIGSRSQEGCTNTGPSFSSVSRRRSYPRRQSASGANSHRRIELSTDLHHPTPSETLATGPKDYISIQQGGGISEGNRPSETNSKILEAVPVQAEANSATRLSTRHSRRRVEPRRVSCPNGEVFRLQKSLSSRDVQTSRHTDSSSDDGERSTRKTERRRIKRTTKPLVWRSRSMQPQDEDSD